VCADNSLLAGFVEVLFRRLLLEDLGNDTVELAADALLPLILAHPDAFQSLGRHSLRGTHLAMHVLHWHG